MKKKLSLLMIALVAIAAFAGLRRTTIDKSVTYALAEGDTFTSGQTVDVKDGNTVVATITYGESGGANFNAAKADTHVQGYTAYTEGNGTNGNKTGGTFYTITPKYNGTIDIAVIINADKVLIVEEDGVALTGFDTQTTKLYGTQTFAVKANKSYKCYVSGSKMGFYGFKLTWQEESADPEPIVWGGDEITLEAGTDMSIPAAMVSGISDGKLVRITATEVEAVASRRALAAEDITILKSDDTELGVTVETINEGYQFTVTGDQANELVQNGFKVKANKTIKISAIEVVDNSQPITPGGDEETSFVKVTSTADITDGDYLIVYEAENVAFNGALETLDAAQNTIPVEINSGVIASSETIDAAIFTFDTTEKTIKSASGSYVGITSYGNGLKQSATLSDNYKHNSFTIDDDKNVIITKTYDSGNMILNYNSNKSDKRFRYYKEGSQKKIQLYKKIGSSTEPDTKVATSIELGDYATAAEVGAEYTLPTATVKEASGATVEGATITWSSSDETVATIDGTSLTLLKAGTTTITATYAGDDTYKEATKSYTLTVTAPAAQVATVAELNALNDKAEFKFTGEALIVAKPTNKYVFIRDNTGSSLIYDNSGSKTESAVVGKTIAANWTGKVSIYNSLFEAVPDAAITVTEAEAIEPEYPEVGFDDFTAENVNKVVILKDVTYTLGSGKNMTFAKNDATVAGYNQFGLEIAAAEEGRTYNIVGAIGRFNDNIQFQPISIERVPAAEITKVQISGAPGVEPWTFVDFTADASQENVYTATLDLSETIENYGFKLVINGGGSEADNWGGWIGTNNVTIDAPEGWGYWTDETEDNKTLWLYNSTTGYKTYTLTATWTPGDNAYKGWTLKIEGKNERIAGDANLDNEVTVSDAVLAVSFVTEKETPTAEQLIAADLDKNNKVEITDVQGIINLALGITEQASASRASELADNTLSIDGNQLLLQNQTMFTGFQMDVTLENGAELNGVQLSDRAKDMTLVCNKVGDNTWRIAAISLSRTAISGNDGCLLTFDVNGNGNVNIKNNIFTDANTQGYNLPLTAPTGISAIKAAMAEGTVVYDMQGRRVENPSKGLYIVNGKKVVLK